MEDKIYTITLDDGSSISNLKMNGNMFVSEFNLNWEYIKDHLSQVIIYDGFIHETHGLMKLVTHQEIDYKYYFVISDVSESELKYAKLKADIDYLIMMTDTDF